MLIELCRAVPEGCASDLRLDEWRAQELNVEETTALEAHFASCARCMARRDQLESLAVAFLARHPALEREPTLGPRKTFRRRVLPHWSLPWLPVMAAASLLTLLLFLSTRDPRDEAVTRSKGGGSVGFVVKRGEELLAGRNGMPVQPGDQLRFFVSAAVHPHVAVLSRDAGGVVTEYYPGTGRSGTLASEAKTFLDSSVELDATLGPEAIWAILCAEAFTTEPLLRELGQTGTVAARPGCESQRLELVKQEVAAP